MINTNAVILTLDGAQTAEFSKGYDYYWIINLGTTDITASVTEDASASDGAVIVPGGGAVCTMHGFSADKLYLNGSGRIQVIGSNSAISPFSAPSGGGNVSFDDVASGAKYPKYTVQWGTVTRATNNTVPTTVFFEKPFKNPPTVFAMPVLTKGSSTTTAGNGYYLKVAETTETSVMFYHYAYSSYDVINWIAFGDAVPEGEKEV